MDQWLSYQPYHSISQCDTISISLMDLQRHFPNRLKFAMFVLCLFTVHVLCLCCCAGCNVWNAPNYYCFDSPFSSCGHRANVQRFCFDVFVVTTIPFLVWVIGILVIFTIINIAVAITCFDLYLLFFIYVTGGCFVLCLVSAVLLLFLLTVMIPMVSLLLGPSIWCVFCMFVFTMFHFHYILLSLLHGFIV